MPIMTKRVPVFSGADGIQGDPLYYERVVVQIQHGRHVVVYPKERATARSRPPAR